MAGSLFNDLAKQSIHWGRLTFAQICMLHVVFTERVESSLARALVPLQVVPLPAIAF